MIYRFLLAITTVFVLLTPLQAYAAEAKLLKGIRGNKITMVKLAVKNGAHLDVQEPVHGDTVLSSASCWGYEAIAKVLLQAKAAVNVQNIYGWTPLMEAANSGHKDIIVLLLDAGADPDIPAYDIKTIHASLASGRFWELAAERADKSFYTIMQTKHPKLLENSKIKKALVGNKNRFVETKKLKAVITNTVPGLIPDLAALIVAYTGEFVAEKPDEGIFSKSSCVIF